MITEKRIGKQTEKTGKQLNEALQDIKKLIWPNLDVKNVIRFMKFSPSWSPQLERAEIEIDLTEEHRTATNALLDSFYKNMTGSEDFDAARDREPIVKISGSQTQSGAAEMILRGDKDFIDKFALVGANLKFDKISKRLGDGEISIGGSEEQQKKAFALFSFMHADENAANELADLSAKVVELMRRMKDKSLPSDEKQKIIADMKSTGSQLKSKLDAATVRELTADQQTGFEASHVKNAGSSKCKITGYFAPVCLAYAVAKRVESGEQVQRWLSMFNGNSIFLEPTSMVKSQDAMGILTQQQSESFADKVRLTGEADEQTRLIVKICNGEMARSAPAALEALRKNIDFEERKLRGNLSPEERAKSEQALAKYRQDLGKRVFNNANELETYMRQKGIGFLTRYYNKHLMAEREKIKKITAAIAYREERQQELEKTEKKLLNAKDDKEKLEIRNKIKKIRDEIQHLTSIIPSDAEGNTSYDEEAEKKKLPADLMQFKTLEALESHVQQFIKKSSGEDLSQTAQIDPNLETPCARRRMKLFAAAERRGAIIYKCADWVIAALPSAKAAQPFGRYRPKVDASGKIIDACNLEDWEGITPENKRRRDSQSGTCIRDGLFNESFETTWCTSGWGHADRRQWGNVVGPGNMFDSNDYASRGALIAFMDCRTGYLYQYGNGSLLDECDLRGGILQSASSMGKLMIKYPSLQRAIIAAGFTKYLTAEDAPKTQAAMLQQLMQSGLMTPSGSVLIRGSDDFKSVLPIIDFIDELKIHPDCSSETVFRAVRENKKPISMPVIDLGGVKNASNMFHNITVTNETLQLKNTDQVENATSMFCGLKFQSPNAEIAGLNTKNVKYANQMFMRCKNTQFRGVRIPNLDFGKCVTMNNAFTQSGIMGISFAGDTARVISAIDAFKGCFMLETMPNVLFKSIRHGRNLASDFEGDYSVIFDGCQKLIRKYRSQPAGTGKTGDKFDDRIEDIKAFYEDSARVQPALDSRGYVIVKTPADAEAAAPILTRREIKGIVIDKAAKSNCLFSGLKLRIKSLDLNGRSDVSYMFSRCEIMEFGEVIGADNVTNAACMFSETTCSIYPTIIFPKCSTMNTFVEAYVADDIPNIQYAPIIQEIQGAGLDVVGDGIPPNAEGDRITSKINQYLFGSYSKDAWEAAHGARRIAEIMYVRPLRATAEDALEKMPKDERGFVILNDAITPNVIKPLIKAKPAGFVFDPDFVQGVNKGELTAEMFQGVKADVVPVIDLNGMQCCGEMFMNCDIGRFEGFENFSSVVDTNKMFAGARIRSALPKLDMQNVQNARQMFYTATLAGGFSGTLDLRNVRNAQQMFSQCSSRSFPFGNEINLPNATETNSMFDGMTGFQSVSLNRVAAPRCANATSMFQSANWLVNVKSVEIGENADAAGGAAVSTRYMFVLCTHLQTVGNVVAPKTADALKMFMNCGELRRVGVINMPRAVNLSYMFANDGALLNICQFLVPSTADGSNMFDGTQIGNRVYGKDGKALLARMRLLGR